MKDHAGEFYNRKVTVETEQGIVLGVFQMGTHEYVETFARQKFLRESLHLVLKEEVDRGFIAGKTYEVVTT